MQMKKMSKEATTYTRGHRYKIKVQKKNAVKGANFFDNRVINDLNKLKKIK